VTVECSMDCRSELLKRLFNTSTDHMSIEVELTAVDAFEILERFQLAVHDYLEQCGILNPFPFIQIDMHNYCVRDRCGGDWHSDKAQCNDLEYEGNNCEYDEDPGIGQ